MSLTPPLSNVVLSEVSLWKAPLSDVDLANYPVGSEGAIGAANLPITASGQGATAAIGTGAGILPVSASGQANFGHTSIGEAILSLTGAGSGFQDWLTRADSLRLQEIYRLVITGAADSLEDLKIGAISSWQATNQAGGRQSYVQAVIPAAGEYIDGIEARQNGELVIEKGYRLANGSVRYEEILRSRFDELVPDRGRQSITVTVSGYLQGKAAPSASRTLTGIRSINARNGKRRVRCDIDMFLQPQMTVTALEESFTVGYINYYVNDSDKFCEVGER